MITVLYISWYRNGSEVVQFQSRAPDFIAGNVHMERLDLDMERCARLARPVDAFRNGIPFSLHPPVLGWNSSDKN